MNRRQRPPRPAPHNYTADINLLHQQIAALTLRWQGVAPPPLSMTEAVEGLTSIVGELQAMNAQLTEAHQEVREAQQHYEANVQEQQAVQEALGQQVRELNVKLDRAELHTRELHHRMKNNLQVLSSLLTWRMGDLHDPRVKAIVQECEGRIHAMALIHELLYRAGDGERLDLGHYLERLAHQVFDAYGVDRERVHLTCQASAVEVGFHTLMPCGLLVHEVLANCLQHAFPAEEGGAVTITLQAEPAGQVSLTIRDTGVGLPPDQAARSEESFGLQLVQALTEQLKGSLAITHASGTCVTISFPV